MKLTFMTDIDITLRDTDPDKNCYKISNLNLNFSFFKKPKIPTRNQGSVSPCFEHQPGLG